MASEVTSDLEFELLYLKNLCSYASLVAIKTLFNKVSQDANIFRSSSVPQSLSGRAIDFLELRSEVKTDDSLGGRTGHISSVGNQNIAGRSRGPRP